MKNLIVLGSILFLTACASDGSTKMFHEPLKAKKNQSIVRVQCTGVGFEETKKICFKKAIQEVVGIALVSNSQIADQEVVQNEIIAHSAGYVYDFDIIERSLVNDTFNMTIDVVVKSSKIQNRIFGNLTDTLKVDGEKLTTQHDSYMDERKTGDQFLNTVLVDYPNKSFVIEKTKHDFVIDKKRTAILSVLFHVKWNYNYLVALNESLKVTQDKRSNKQKQERIMVISKPPNSSIGSSDMYFFSDSVRANQIKQKFIGDISVVANVYDWNNNLIMSECSRPIFPVGLTTGDPDSPYTIRGNDVFRGEIKMSMTINDPKYKAFKEAQRIEVSINKGKCAINYANSTVR